MLLGKKIGFRRKLPLFVVGVIVCLEKQRIRESNNS
jgi:hypothetical protein